MHVRFLQTSKDKARSVRVRFQRFMHVVLGEAVEVAPLRSDALNQGAPLPTFLIPTSPSSHLFRFWLEIRRSTFANDFNGFLTVNKQHLFAFCLFRSFKLVSQTGLACTQKAPKKGTSKLYLSKTIVSNFKTTNCVKKVCTTYFCKVKIWSYTYITHSGVLKNCLTQFVSIGYYGLCGSI